MPFSRAGLVQAASDAGFVASERLVTDWVGIGLLAPPERQRGKQGKRGAVYLWPDMQKELFINLLQHRREVGHVGELAPIPVGVWLLWGEPWIDVSQARHALVTWLGGHRKASSLERATASARAVVNQFAQKGSSRAERKALRDALIDANMSGEFDRDGILPLIIAVVDPQRSGARPIGPFQNSAEDVADYYYALMLATSRVDQLTDGHFIEARARYREFVVMYLQNWPRLGALPVFGHTFEEPTLEALFNRCCKDLLTFLGLVQLSIERGVQPPPVLLTSWTGPPQQLINRAGRPARPSG